MSDPFDQFDSPQPTQAPTQQPYYSNTAQGAPTQPVNAFGGVYVPPTTPPSGSDPFGQFDAPTQPAAPSKEPTKHLTLGQALAQGYGNLKPGLDEFLSAASNTLANPGESAKALVGTASKAATSLIHPTTNIFDPFGIGQDISNAGSAVKNYLAERYGSWDAIKNSIANHPYQTLSDLSIPMSLGATTAEAVGADTAARGMNALALGLNPTNAALVGAGNVASAGGRMAVNALTPQTRIVMDMLNGQGPEISARAREAISNPIVPGSMPNVSQALGANPVTGAAAINAPKINALQDAANARYPELATALRDQQAAAQQAQLGRIGGTFDANQLEAIREATANQNYGIMRGINSDVDNELTRILNLPLNHGVTQRAANLAEQQGRPFMVQDVRQIPNPDYQGSPANSLAPATRASDESISPTITQTVDQLPGQSLQDINRAFQGLISRAENNVEGLSPQEANALNETLRQQFLPWAERNNPAMGVARQTYAALSGQIDRARLRDVLQQKLTQSPNAFLAAQDTPLNELTGNRLTTLATGDRPEALGQVLTPGEAALNQSVIDDIARQQWADTQAAAGSGHAGNMTTAASDATPSVPHVAGKTGAVANALRYVLTAGVNQRIANRLGQAAFDLPTMADIIDNALTQQANLDNYGLGIRRVANFLNTPNRYPTLYNVIQNQKNQQGAQNQ